MARRVFGMISTRASQEYTAHAFRTFMQHTPFVISDRFVMIDNDGDLQWDAPSSDERFTLVQNPAPESFAANANKIMAVAENEGADLYLLNNDLIFTNGWLEGLWLDTPQILSPLSNREVQYKSGSYQWRNHLTLAEYLGRERELSEVVEQHRNTVRGYRSVLSLPFFCVKIPVAVFKSVGRFDERFGIGGGEDNDYCLRAWQAGFQVKYANNSFVLHFSGRSTWAGAESREATAQRVLTYRSAFEAKWGRSLTELLIDENNAVLRSDPRIADAVQRSDMRALIELLRSPPHQ